jgi:hypothetical protein
MSTTSGIFAANCQTTAMGIMPHTDVERALELALSLDIPFWPQLPNLSFYEDMYAQASEHFPGIRVDREAQRVTLDIALFGEEVAEAYLARLEQPEAFILSQRYSCVYQRFLELDLASYSAIRGQLIGPVSFGFRVIDEEMKPIIYNDEVRTILFDFLQRKANAQYWQLRERNQHAFVWLDEPGLGWVFSGMTGYNDQQARADYQALLSGIEGPRGLHLCASVNLPYLLELGVDILSFDAYQLQTMPSGYTEVVGAFLKRGGIISWGIVPTDPEGQEQETPQGLAEKLAGYWEVVSRGTGQSLGEIARQSLVAPARCMLKNVGRVGAVGEGRSQQDTTYSTTEEERLVETGFEYTKVVSRMLQERYL